VVGKNARDGENTPLWKTEYGLWAAAFIFLLSGLLIDQISKPTAILYVGSPERSPWWSIAVDAFKSIGLALAGLGLVNILLEAKDWRAYFEARLKSILIDQTYLEGLDTVTLERLNENILKRQFKDAIIDSRAGFLSHFNKHIRRYIAAPYRENMQVELCYSEAGSDEFKIIETTSYACRSNGTHIQESIDFELEENARVVDVDMYIARPGQTPERVHYEANNPSTRFSLAQYANEDRLSVRIRSEYYKRKTESYSWRMTLPTRSVTLFFVFPPQYRVTLTMFVDDDDSMQTTAESQTFKVSGDTWLLPDNGFCWSLRPSGASSGDTAHIQQRSSESPDDEGSRDPEA
jgi:hypothetical protein